MRRKSFSARKAGLAPGMLLNEAAVAKEPPAITLFSYDEVDANGRAVPVERAVEVLAESVQTVWINVEGLWDADVLKALGQAANVHQLVLEDIQNPEQRPKTEDHGDYVYSTCKMARWDNISNAIDLEHVSLIIGNHYVISFQEKAGDVFDHVRNRILNGRGRIRKAGADYLGYAMIDALVDNYFIVLEHVEEQIEALEDDALSAKGSGFIEEVKVLRRSLMLLRRAIWPLRDMVSGLCAESVSLVADDTRMFIRDVLDHVMQLMDMMDGVRETSNSLMDSYLSMVSFTMNQVMKVLTIIATIFIPLTFIAGIYGMNFQWMPELAVRWAYPAVLAFMAALFAAMIVWFKRKKWL